MVLPFSAMNMADATVTTVLPFSAMNTEDATVTTEKADKKTKQIEKPTDSKFEIETKVKVEKLFLERITLEDKGKHLKGKQQKYNADLSLSSHENKKLEKISDRLEEISAEFGKINNESRKLYATTPQQKNFLTAQQQLVRDSNIPFHSIGTDMKEGALFIGFENQKIADKNISKLDEMLSVPYYFEISEPDVDFGCQSLTSNCNPLVGGIQIQTEKDSAPNGWTECSISVPMYRNVHWWTEEGFVTAGHCFGNELGNDARQPSGSTNKVGDVTKTQNSGECDCAFVKKSSSESTLFGNWWGSNNSNPLLSKGDALLGDYVVMIGKESGIKVGKVISTTYDASGIQNMHKINYRMSGGDSGGMVIDLTTFNVYQGLIKGGSHTSVTPSYTSVVPWSHIDNALDLQ